MMIGKYGYDAVTILLSIGLWAVLVGLSVGFVLITGPIILKVIHFFRR